MLKAAAALCALLTFAAQAALAADAPLSADQVCQAATYRLSDGRYLDVGPTTDQDLRWRLGDGRSGRLSAKDHWSSTLGWTGKPDGVVVTLPPCGGDTIAFAEPGHAPVTGHKVPLDVQDVAFESEGVTLQGRLVMPRGSGKVPVMVETHGSESSAATIYYYDQRLYAAQGVGVFVYDKRGTGRSGGKYTQDYPLLARDAVAALAQARRLAGARLGRVGFEGGSQGGWVAPLAATLTPVDFVIVDYGLAGSVAEENIDQTVLELKRKGYGPQDLREAAEVAEAANQVFASHFKSGFEGLDAVRAKYGSKPWFKELNGQYTGLLLQYPTDALRKEGPAKDMGTPVYYDTIPVLKRVKAPMLWVLGDEDTLAPNATTRVRLKALVAEGSDITAIAFPGADHGIYEFMIDAKGERQSTRIADGYYRTTLDWAKTGRIRPPYGRSRVILTPRK